MTVPTATGLTVRPHRPMTTPQSAFIRDLLAKVTEPAVVGPIRTALNTHRERGTLTIEVASAFITSLKAVIVQQGAAPSPAPAVVVPAPVAVAAPAPVAPVRLPYPSVTDGRYAVEVDGAMRWYNVTHYAGATRTSLKRYVSDNLVKVSAGEQVRVLRMIEADEKGAALRFAATRTRCYVCGRALTDTDPGGSVDKGIGPDCEAKGLGY